MISLVECRRVLLDGPTFQNSPAWNIHPLLCEDVVIRNITVLNPWYSQNGDGLDLDSCRRVIVHNCRFDVGDDAICIKSGKDEDGPQARAADRGRRRSRTASSITATAASPSAARCRAASATSSSTLHVPGHRRRPALQDHARPRRRGREDLHPRRPDDGHPHRRHRLQHVLRRRGADRGSRQAGGVAPGDAGRRGHAAVPRHRAVAHPLPRRRPRGDARGPARDADPRHRARGRAHDGAQGPGDGRRRRTSRCAAWRSRRAPGRRWRCATAGT